MREQELSELSISLEQVGWIALILVAIGLVFVYARYRWARLRPLMGLKSEAVQKLERPGLLHERLEKNYWKNQFWEILAQTRRNLEAEPGEAPRGAALAIAQVEQAGGGLVDVVHEAAMRAMMSGDLGSVLVRIDPELLLEVIVVPAGRDDPRPLRRSTALVDGWFAHARHLLAAAQNNQSENPRLLGLVYCLDLTASQGFLDVAYEGNGLRFASAPLSDEAPAIDPSSATNFAHSDVLFTKV